MPILLELRLTLLGYELMSTSYNGIYVCIGTRKIHQRMRREPSQHTVSMFLQADGFDFAYVTGFHSGVPGAISAQ